MPDRTRTFIAVALPDDRAAQIVRLRDRIAPELPGVRWVEPTNYHVTLAFLGDVENADLNGLCRAVEEAAREFAPFDLRIEGPGAFPGPDRPRTIWVGLAGSGIETLRALQKEVARAARGAGYPPVDDRFTPHVTIGRTRTGRGRPGARSGTGRPPDATRPIEQHQGWSGGTFRVAEVVAFASHLTPDGPEYAPLARAALRGGKTGRSA